MSDESPSSDKVFELIRNVLVNVKSASAPVLPEQILADSTFEEPPLSMDSLDFAQFVVGVESEFGMIAYDSDFFNLRTVQDAVDLVRRTLSADPAGQGHFG